MSEEDNSLKIGGFNISGLALGIAIPVLSALSGGIYYGYDVLNRFYSVEEGVTDVWDMGSRLQSLEQTVSANDVDGLSAKLANISTQMTTILEQQRSLLDLRSKIERSETITTRLDGALDKYDTEIEDLWRAVDELNSNPIGR